MDLSVIVPVLNEVERIAPLAHSLPGGLELIFADGGSSDGTVSKIDAIPGAILIPSSPPRSRQMNDGAEASSNDRIVFLHADTRLPPNGPDLVHEAFERGAEWGFFRISIDSRNALLRLAERLWNLRVGLTKGATGDQVIFLDRRTAGRRPFREIPLFEDLDLVRRLKRRSPPFIIREPATTSARRWERYGVVRTILLMWLVRAAYLLGVPPSRLAGWYG